MVSNDEEIYSMIKKFSIYDRFDQNLEPGNNIRMSEVHALLSYSIIREWKEIINNKKNIANRYISFCEKYNINYISQEKMVKVATITNSLFIIKICQSLNHFQI